MVLVRLIADSRIQTIADFRSLERRSIADFSRHGLEGTVTVDDIVPTTSQERSAFLDEMEDLVDFHYQKRSRQYQNLCRKFAGDIDGDDPIIVEGDG